MIRQTLLAGMLIGLAAGRCAHPAMAADASAGSLSLTQLLGLFAQRPSAQAHFRQTQQLAALTRPLQSEGTLIYRAPDYLEQRVSRPRAADMVLDHGQLTMRVGRRRRTVALADYPQLSPLLDSVRATLAGDQAALEQHFRCVLTGTLDQWQLQLTPRGSELAALVMHIELRGAGAEIHDVHIVQVNGDQAELQLQPLPADSPPAGP
jgi:hypothetical protein